MNYTPLINELKSRHARVVQAIAALELIEQPKSTRGRKPGMPPAERQQVSERMKRYWAGRRRERAAGGGQ